MDRGRQVGTVSRKLGRTLFPPDTASVASVSRSHAGSDSAFQAPCCDAEAFALRVLAVECDTLKELVPATGSDSAATVASIGLLEPRMGERRTVIAWSRDQRVPVAGLKRTLQRAAVAISALG